MSDAPRRGDHAIHRSSHLGYEPENAYGGVLSFMRRRYTRDLAGVDVAVTGIPLDVATTFRPGARLGPAAVRAATVQLNEKLHPWGFGPCDHHSRHCCHSGLSGCLRHHRWFDYLHRHRAQLG